MSVELQNEPWIPGGVPVPMSWDPVGKLWVPSPPAPGSITTAMLAPNAVTATHMVEGVAGSPSTTAGSYSAMPDMSISFTAPVVEDLLCIFTAGAFTHTTTSAISNVAFQLDGAPIISFSTLTQPNIAGGLVGLTTMWLFPAIAAGAHTLVAMWQTNAGTLTNYGINRVLQCVELRR